MEPDDAAGHTRNAGSTASSGDSPDPDGRTAAAAAAGNDPLTSSAAAAPAASTGEPRVDAALRLLDRLPDLPVSEHAELYEQVREQLSDVLGELDTGPGN